MKSISFGPVTHKDKSYAYALGYGAYVMGYPQHHNPYGTERQEHADFNAGHDAAKVVVDQNLTTFIEENA